LNKSLKVFLLASMITTTLTSPAFASENSYTVKSGDSLYAIAKQNGTTVSKIQELNNIEGTLINIGQVLRLPASTTITNYLYTVKSGDSLTAIARDNQTTVGHIMKINSLSTTTIKIGQSLKIEKNTNKYKVVAGDTLYLISKKFGTSITELKTTNLLTSDIIHVGQVLTIPYRATLDGGVTAIVSAPVLTTPAPTPTPTIEAPTASDVKAITVWPSKTYIVQSGDTGTAIAKKFGVSFADLMKYNYMDADDWFNAGQKIAINGYAPRNYDVVPGQSTTRQRYGTPADWFLDGQYILKRNVIVEITDTVTGKHFKAKVMGGYQHADIEPLTTTDTAVMKELFSTWVWKPRPVAIFVDGMNIAGSLSGMPHSFDTTPSNGVTGHFDLYMKNSVPHSGSTSATYVQQHYANIPLSSIK
jgi:LysM repeat protein